MKTKIILLCTLFLLSAMSVVMAQVFVEPVNPVVPAVFDTPQFLVCLVAGVLLAIGFQVLLTTLSVASGISLIGNVKDKFSGKHQARDKHQDYNKAGTNYMAAPENDRIRRSNIPYNQPISYSEYKELENEDYDDDKHAHSSTPVLVKIGSAIGIWTILTVSISLFLASLFAVKLSLLSNNAIGATLGLVIWATFFTIITYLEINSVSSLIGGIFNTALSGLRSSFGTVKDMMGFSKEDKMARVAKNTVEEIRKEVADAMDNSKITRKLDEYIDKLQPQELDYAQIRKEMAKLLKDVELRETSEMADDGLIRHTFIKIAESQPHLSKKNIHKLSEIFDEVKSAAQTEGSNSDKVMAAVDKLTPGTEENTRNVRERIENYLRNTKREELNPDSLKRDIEAIISDPKSAGSVIKNRFSQLDRSTITALLAQRKDISEERANQIVGYVEKAFDAVKQKFAGSDSSNPTSTSPNAAMPGINYDPVTATETIAATAGNTNQPQSQGMMSKFEDKMRNYLSSLQRPEFNYDRLKMDFEQIFHEPGATFTILKNRLSQYDRDSLVALLSSRENISKQDAERMVSKLEESRDAVINKAEKVENEVKMRLKQAKEIALQEAENARKAAATAAWWLFATAVISAVASAIGGMLAITA